MDFTGRPLKGFVLVAASGIRTAAALKKWVDETVSFALSIEHTKKTSSTKARRGKVGASKTSRKTGRKAVRR